MILGMDHTIDRGVLEQLTLWSLQRPAAATPLLLTPIPFPTPPKRKPGPKRSDLCEAVAKLLLGGMKFSKALEEPHVKSLFPKVYKKASPEERFVFKRNLRRRVNRALKEKEAELQETINSAT
jgi:hypothetical protein